MNFFIDSEFHEYFVKASFFSDRKIHTVEPIELAIVAENGESISYLYNDFDTDSAWRHTWLRQNVIQKYYDRQSLTQKQLGGEFSYKWFKAYVKSFGRSKVDIAQLIQQFIKLQSPNEEPIFYAYFADYDWIAFCQTFGTMMELPKNYPQYCKDLKQILDEKAERLFRRKAVILNDEGKKYPKEELTHEHYVQAIKNRSDYPKQIIEHVAEEDAKWNLQLFKFLQTI